MTMASERRGNAHVPQLRNANNEDLLALLAELKGRRVDCVVPAEKAKFVNGMLEISGQEPYPNEDGVTDPNGLYWPTGTFDAQIADRLDVPVGYIRRLRNGRRDANGKELSPPRLDVYDSTVNALLHGRKARATTVNVRDEKTREVIGTASEQVWEALPHDPRKFMFRGFTGDAANPGIARAWLSNSYAPLEHFDGLYAVLQGVLQAGINPDTLRISGDLTETKLYVQIDAPEILAAAPGLMADYRSPFDSTGGVGRRQGHGYTIEQRIEMGRRWREDGGARGHHMYPEGEEPLVHASALFTNSEVGLGRWSLKPRLVFVRCTNGLTIVREGFARAHLGSRQEEGVVAWSEETQSKELAWVASQTSDVMRQILDPAWLQEKVDELEVRAGRVIDQPDRAIQVISRRLGFTEAEREGILRHFLVAGQSTSGGVMNAVTSFSQTIEDIDRSHEVNDRAIEALELAFAMS